MGNSFHTMSGLLLKWWFGAILWLIFLSAAAGPVQTANPWAKVETPGPGKAEAIGLANAGCVNGAKALPLDGFGYRVMRPSRNRYYGHPELVNFIQSLGRQVERHGIGTLLVGDLAQPRGGPMAFKHRSHQSGLDVDLWFWLPHHIGNRSLSANEREQWQAPSMLAADGVSLHPLRWTKDQEQLLQIAAQQPAVDRIFVNPAIKRELCRSKAGSQWLRKVRPWWGHDDHLHIRLRCPSGENRCMPQEALPLGNGCDASLAWWFSDEARQQPSKPSKDPDLPAACLVLINGQ